MLDVLRTIEKIGNVKKFSNLSIEEIKSIRKALKLVNDFNKNINNYGEHIFKSEYLLSVSQLKEKLPEKDFKKLKLSDSDYRSYVYCYKKKILYNHSFRSGWIMGASSGVSTNYVFDERNRLLVVHTWKTKSARLDHIPWISRERIITIDLVTREILGDDGDSFMDLG